MRRIPVVAIAIVAGAFVASDAESVSQVSATASGQLYNTPKADGGTGDGHLPVLGEIEYSGPEPVEGRFAADAFAAVGLLGGSAFVTVTLGPGSFTPRYEGRAQASFRDRWTFGGKPTDTLGRLRLTVNFAGAATETGSADTARTSFGRFDLSMTSLDATETPIGPNGIGVYNSGPQNLINHDEVVEIDFLYGRPIDVQGELFVLASVGPTTQGVDFAGECDAVFDNAVEFRVLEVQDGGQWTTSYVLTTESGGTYPFQVPEPASAALAMTSVAALAVARMVRGRG